MPAPTYYLKIEFNGKNHLIFSLIENKVKQIGYLLLEDCQRSGMPEDFQFLHPVFLKNWDDFRNLITVKIITFQALSAIAIDEITYLAETLIEFKPAVNPKLEFIVSKDFNKFQNAHWNHKSHDNHITILKYLLENFTETPPNYEALSSESLNHLSQSES